VAGESFRQGGPFVDVTEDDLRCLIEVLSVPQHGGKTAE
jgi:hypothetical protein